MPVSLVRSFCLVGVDAVPVSVEVDILRRLPALVIVGLPASTARETGERVRAAIEASGYAFPRARVVVNVAPADLRKDGAGLDLPIAIGILVASGQVDPSVTEGRAFVGELSCGGEVHDVRGIVAMAEAARLAGVSLVTSPGCALAAARTVGDLADVGVGAARSLLDAARGVDPLLARDLEHPETPAALGALDFSTVRGNLAAWPLLVQAAASRRPVLLRGPAGCGATMIAARLPGILPALTVPEAIEVARVQDAAGLADPATVDPRTVARPFRAPHHTVSTAGLVGGSNMRPGEVTLAHRGVLFLDGIEDFPRAVLSTLGSVTQRGMVRYPRGAGPSVDLPADPWIVMHSEGDNERTRAALVALGFVGERAPIVVDLERAHVGPWRGDDDAHRWPDSADLRRRVQATRTEATAARAVLDLDRGILCAACGYDEPGTGPADRERAPDCPACGSGATGIRWMLGRDGVARFRAEHTAIRTEIRAVLAPVDVDTGTGGGSDDCGSVDDGARA